MYIRILYQKNRIDGNIHHLVHAVVGKEPTKVVETNTVVDSLLCVYDFDYMTTSKTEVATVSTPQFSVNN